MAVYLPVRAISRSQGIRVGGQTLSTTTTAYVDISDGKTRKELQNHQALGAVVVVGSLTASNSDGVVSTGAIVDQGSSATDLILGVSAGEVRNRSTGVHAAVAATATAVTIAAADTTNPRWDLVVADTTSGVVSKVDGVAAASPALPATPAGKVALAKVVVAANATGLANAVITDIRPRP